MTSYPEKLNAIVEQIETHMHSKSSAVLRDVVNGLENGVISGLLFTLDDSNFNKVIDLLYEFRSTGHTHSFNTLHAEARQRVLFK